MSACTKGFVAAAVPLTRQCNLILRLDVVMLVIRLLVHQRRNVTAVCSADRSHGPSLMGYLSDREELPEMIALLKCQGGDSERYQVRRSGGAPFTKMRGSECEGREPGRSAR
jgi:hypothetical protein